jgi:hypothetical protein
LLNATLKSFLSSYSSNFLDRFKYLIRDGRLDANIIQGARRCTVARQGYINITVCARWLTLSRLNNSVTEILKFTHVIQKGD